MAKIETVKNKKHQIIHPVTSVGAVEGLNESLSEKQETLVSGKNIRTINGHTILGGGNLNIAGSGEVFIIDDEMSAYSENAVQNKVITASINNLLQIIQSMKQFRYESVESLPTPPSAETMGIIYLTPAADTSLENTKDEYITIRSGEEGDYTYAWERLGSTEIDLSDYPTEEEMQEAIADALAAYITNVNATVDANTGTPSVTTSFDAGVLTLEFHNLKGNTGPGIIEVQTTIDDNSGVPEVTASLVDQVLTLAFKNLKGIQGVPGIGIASISTAQDGSFIISLTDGNTITINLSHNHLQYYTKAVETIQPVSGFLPDVSYNIGTIQTSAAFLLGTPINGNLNHYYWIFRTGSTVPAISWPSSIVQWNGNCLDENTGLPEIEANKRYEVSIIDGVAFINMS